MPNPAIALYYEAAGGRPWPERGEACALCGDPCGPCHLAKKTVGDNFNDWDKFRDPAGAFLCPSCHYYLSEQSWQEDRDGASKRMRRAFFAWKLHKTDAGAVALRWERKDWRRDIEGYLSEGIPAHSVLIIPTSYQKHLVWDARPTLAGSRTICVQYELDSLLLIPDAWRRLTLSYDALKAMGVPRKLILAAEMPNNLSPSQWRTAKAHLDTLRPYAGLPILDFINHVTPNEG